MRTSCAMRAALRRHGADVAVDDLDPAAVLDLVTRELRAQHRPERRGGDGADVGHASA